MADWLGDLETARIACAKARDSHETARSVLGVVYSDLIRGLTKETAGDLKRAYAHFQRAAQHARDEVGAGSYAEAVAGIFEVDILYEWNDLAAAESRLQQHRRVIEECGLVVHEITCKLHAARLAAALGRHDEAQTVLERDERKGLQTRYQRLFASAIHERVRLLLVRGDIGAAKLVLMTRGIDENWIASHRPPLPASEPVHMAFARLLIADQRPEAALRILDALAEPMRKGGRMRRFAQIRALSAMASFQAGDALSALAAIVDAVSLCAPQGALRSLIDEGDSLQDVISFGRERIPSWKSNGEIGQFLDKLVFGRTEQVQNGERHESKPGRTPHFSAREADVARLLSCGQNNREMAQTLSMAPDTVKWHLKNIFGKLGVSNRTQTVLRLQGLGVAGKADPRFPLLN
ncbi:MAG: LuxR C-terminal-related transcriptional regulator [Aestuariivirga sp.]